MYESWDEMTFGDMPDLSIAIHMCIRNCSKLARWLVEEVGFDGFRYDFELRAMGANTITAIQEYRYMRDGHYFRPYGVAEFWDNARASKTGGSCQLLQLQPGGRVRFSPRELLKELCDSYGLI